MKLEEVIKKFDEKFTGMTLSDQVRSLTGIDTSALDTAEFFLAWAACMREQIKPEVTARYADALLLMMGLAMGAFARKLQAEKEAKP